MDTSLDITRALKVFIRIRRAAQRRPPGRLRQTWLRTLEPDLQPLNLGFNSAWKCTQDREHWKHLVETDTLQPGACSWLMMIISCTARPYQQFNSLGLYSPFHFACRLSLLGAEHCWQIQQPSTPKQTEAVRLCRKKTSLMSLWSQISASVILSKMV